MGKSKFCYGKAFPFFKPVNNQSLALRRLLTSENTAMTLVRTVLYWTHSFTHPFIHSFSIHLANTSEHLLCARYWPTWWGYNGEPNETPSGTTLDDFISLCLFPWVLRMLLQGRHYYCHFLDEGTRRTDVKAKIPEPVNSKEGTQPLGLTPKLVLIPLVCCHYFGSMKIKGIVWKLFSGFIPN